jgi:hypothetical protein
MNHLKGPNKKSTFFIRDLFLLLLHFLGILKTMEILGVSAQADVPSFVFIVNDTPKL